MNFLDKLCNNGRGGWTLIELRQMCKDAGLKTSGNKIDLCDRLHNNIVLSLSNAFEQVNVKDLPNITSPVLKSPTLPECAKLQIRTKTGVCVDLDSEEGLQTYKETKLHKIVNESDRKIAEWIEVYTGNDYATVKTKIPVGAKEYFKHTIKKKSYSLSRMYGFETQKLALKWLEDEVQNRKNVFNEGDKIILNIKTISSWSKDPDFGEHFMGRCSISVKTKVDASSVFVDVDEYYKKMNKVYKESYFKTALEEEVVLLPGIYECKVELFELD